MRSDVFKIFIGYDPVESVAWHVMAHSLLRQSSIPLALVPVNIDNLKSIYTRPRDPKQSNAFSFTRFLAPYLAGYEGFAAYFDCDQMLRTDVAELLDVPRRQPGRAVYVVKHDYQPRDGIKYLNTVQYVYPRKNWSSVILWDCAHPSNRVVTPEFVNSAPALELHRFQWLRDEEIGDLDFRWNWLVGEYDAPPSDVRNVHWTLGGPYFHESRTVDFADEWFEESRRVNFCLQRGEKG